MQLISERIEQTGLEVFKLKLFQNKLLNEGFDKVNYLEVLNEETLGDLNKVAFESANFFECNY